MVWWEKVGKGGADTVGLGGSEVGLGGSVTVLTDFVVGLGGVGCVNDGIGAPVVEWCGYVGMADLEVGLGGEMVGLLMEGRVGVGALAVELSFTVGSGFGLA